MYEKTLYKVETQDNKELYRLQDLTKSDNVETSMLKEGRNSQGKKRLECQVIVMHPEELDAIYDEVEQAKADVEELRHEIKQKNVEIKRLQGELAKHERANIDYEAKLQGEKFNMLVSHQKALDELRETHENDLLAIDKEHRKHLERMSAQYKQSYDELNDRLFNSVKANNNMRGKYKAEALALKDEVVSLQKQHHDEVEKLQHAHSNELQDIREQHAYDIDTLKTALADEKQEHLTEVGKLQREHIHDIDEMRAKFLKLLASEHAQDLSDFNDCGELPFIARVFAKGFVNSFDEFKKRKQLNTPQKIVETYELAPSRDE